MEGLESFVIEHVLLALCFVPQRFHNGFVYRVACDYPVDRDWFCLSGPVQPGIGLIVV